MVFPRRVVVVWDLVQLKTQTVTFYIAPLSMSTSHVPLSREFMYVGQHNMFDILI